MHRVSVPLLGPVRVAKGLTQVEVARQSAISQAVISGLESGRTPMTGDIAATLAGVLEAPPELLQASAPNPRVLQRLQKSLPAQTVKTLSAEFSLAHFHARLLLGRASPLIPRLEGASPSDRAAALRRAWRVPSGPIDNVVRLLEAHGVVVLLRDTSGLRTPALGSWSKGEHPIIFLGIQTPPREARVALAREIGHAVMHNEASTAGNVDADEFAAGFLLPPDDIVWTRSGPMDRSRLGNLEEEWGVSASVLLAAARGTDAISATLQRKLNSIVLDIGTDASPHPRERPRTLLESVQRRVAAGVSIESVAARALLTRETLHTKFLAGAG